MVKVKVFCHGKQINGFSTKPEAQSSCDYMTKQFKKEFTVYYCENCKMFHISPKERETKCYLSECLDSNGQPKQSYLTEKEANTRRDIIFKEKGKKLNVYKCSNCGKFHLTHKNYNNNDDFGAGINKSKTQTKETTISKKMNDNKCVIY